jgi:hypothetical protein
MARNPLYHISSRVRTTICFSSTIRTDSWATYSDSHFLRQATIRHREAQRQVRRIICLQPARGKNRVSNSGGPRAISSVSPDSAERWGKRFWQSCRGKAESGATETPSSGSRLFSLARVETAQSVSLQLPKTGAGFECRDRRQGFRPGSSPFFLRWLEPVHPAPGCR